MSEEIKADTDKTVAELLAPPPHAPPAESESVSTPIKQAKILNPTKVPTSGQSAPPITLEWDKLNAKERKLIEFLDGSGTGVRSIVTIPQLAAECFFGVAETEAQANSWVRNSLRRLARGGDSDWVEKFVRGSYRISVRGRMKLKFVDD
jgi:hypothetical protein